MLIADIRQNAFELVFVFYAFEQYSLCFYRCFSFGFGNRFVFRTGAAFADYCFQTLENVAVGVKN